MSEYIVDYRWLRSRLFGQVEHLRDDLPKIVRYRDCKYSGNYYETWWCTHFRQADGDYSEVVPDGLLQVG